MSHYTGGATTVCPFYLRENDKTLTCEGCTWGSTTTMRFARRQELVYELLLVGCHLGVQRPDDVLDGVLLVAAVALLPGLQLVERHPEKSGDVLHAQLGLLHKLRVAVAHGDGLVLKPKVEYRDPRGV